MLLKTTPMNVQLNAQAVSIEVMIPNKEIENVQSIINMIEKLFNTV